MKIVGSRLRLAASAAVFFLGTGVVACGSSKEESSESSSGGSDGGGESESHPTSGGSDSGPSESSDGSGDSSGSSSGGGSSGSSGVRGGSSGSSGSSGGSSGSSGSGSSGGSSGSSGGSGSGGSSDGGDDDAGTVTSADGFGPSRAACINKINALRATDTAVALAPLTLENTDTLNSCVDTQASTDESKNSSHYAFINNAPSCTWGSARAFAQDECQEGYGTTPTGIEKCLQDMWDESLKPNCLGCVGCTAFGGACSNCDYSGTLGYECGHYVNMSAPYFTMVACGFAGEPPSSSTAWSVQNFE